MMYSTTAFGEVLHYGVCTKQNGKESVKDYNAQELKRDFMKSKHQDSCPIYTEFLISLKNGEFIYFQDDKGKSVSYDYIMKRFMDCKRNNNKFNLDDVMNGAPESAILKAEKEKEIIKNQQVEIEKNLKIPESLLRQYKARVVATSIDNHSKPQQKDLLIELKNDEGHVIKSSEYTYKLKSVSHQAAGTGLPLMLDMEITLANGQKFTTDAYMSQNFCDEKDSPVKINNTNKVIISRYSNNTVEGIERCALSGVREQIFNNHKGVLTLNVLDDINKYVFHCNATLNVNDKAYIKNNIEISVTIEPNSTSVANISIGSVTASHYTPEQLKEMEKRFEQAVKEAKEEREYKEKVAKLKKEREERENKKN